jgi:TldD protein
MSHVLSPDPNRWFEQFDVTDELIQAVLSAATIYGADDADLFFEHTTSTAVALTDRAVNRARTSVDLGVGIRVVVGDQVGYAYTESLTRESMIRAAHTAAQIAKTAKTVGPVSVSPIVLPNYYPMSQQFSEVAVGDRVPLVRKWEEWAFAADPRVQRVQTSLSDADKYILVVSADGRRAADYRPMTRASVSCTVEDGDTREAGSYNVSARDDMSYYSEDRQRRMVAQAIDRATRALSAESPPAGEMPVVMAAGSSGILLHEAIGHGMEADFNRKNISIYSDKLGKRIAPVDVTVCDDATIPSARGALNVDDEGSATQNTVLVRNGILETYLHDKISARHYGVKPTGSGRRESFRHAVLPRMRCTYMRSGPHSPDDIIRSVKRGIYCESFQNGQVHIGGGDFAFFVRHGYLIEDGKLTAPVKDVNIIGNGPKVLETIEMVGNDMIIDEGGWTCGKEGQSVPVSQGMPTVKVGNLSVGGGR